MLVWDGAVTPRKGVDAIPKAGPGILCSQEDRCFSHIHKIHWTFPRSFSSLAFRFSFYSIGASWKNSESWSDVYFPILLRNSPVLSGHWLSSYNSTQFLHRLPGDSIKPHKFGLTRLPPFQIPIASPVYSQSEAQVTNWTCDWHLKWKAGEAVLCDWGLNPWGLQWLWAVGVELS